MRSGQDGEVTSFRLQSLTSIPIEPWKNGGGSTQLLAAGRGWRVSLAQVVQDGPFSVFEGMTRHSVVIAGEGLQLASAATIVSLVPGELASYDGEMPWQCRLQGAAAMVLNIMCEREAASADVQLGTNWNGETTEAQTLVVLALNGTMRFALDGGAARIAPRGSILVCNGPAAVACEAAGGYLVSARLMLK